ncbi:hypothetical protein, partial [Nocardioides sp. AN3]
MTDPARWVVTVVVSMLAGAVGAGLVLFAAGRPLVDHAYEQDGGVVTTSVLTDELLPVRTDVDDLSSRTDDL